MDNLRPLRPRPRASKKKPGRVRVVRRRTTWIVAGIIVVVALVALARLLSLYVEWLWFGELDQRGVFWTEFWGRLVTGLLAGLLVFAVLYANAWLARRLAPTYGVTEEGDLVEARSDKLRRAVSRVALAATALIGVFTGLAYSGRWLVWLQAIEAQSFGRDDPVFGRDLSFFILELPAWQSLLTLLQGAVIGAIVVAGLVHLAMGSIGVTYEAAVTAPGSPARPPQVGVRVAGVVVAHGSVLLAALFVLVGIGQLVRAWNLLLSAGGVVFGAVYTDVVIRLPMTRVTMVLAFVLAGLLVYNAVRRRSRWWPVGAIVIWVAALIVVRGIVPAAVQSLVVNPNQLSKERQYIDRNLRATRAAYDLEDITQKKFPLQRQLTVKDLADDSATLRNIRLWDPRTLRTSYRQLQLLRPYYTFVDVDVDRYTLDGVYRQTMLAARELDIDGLPAQARTWVNEHITYTHGFGVAMSAVNQVTSDGSPDFLVQDIPLRSAKGLEVDQPRIYFGEVGTEYTLVKTKEREFDYPGASGDVFTEYKGSGGVPVGSFLNRLAFSWQFGTIKFFTTTAIDDDSRIIFRNDIRERLERVAPFLAYDGDPYMVIARRRLFWVVDAYTLTDRYPYATPTGDLNYVRNSVKAVVDAYNGSVNLYAFDETDPLLRTYRAIFPDLFRPRDEMPAELMAHVRYPEDLFNVQAEVWSTYHVQDAAVLYNKGDQWQIPENVSLSGEGRMEAYYVIMRLPGESQEEYLLMLPFVPNGRANMVAWLGARSDMPQYGTALNYVFPEGVTVFGPGQVESAINADPVISAQRSLWDQQGSSVILGNLLVTPIADALLYVQPLYLQAERTQLPQLKRVIVFYRAPDAAGESQQRVVMQPTLGEALAEIFGADSEQDGAGADTDAGGEAGGGAGEGGTGGGTPPPGPVGAQAAALIRRANSQFEAAQRAQQAGDWAEYGRQIEALERTLRQLEGLQP